jgi:tetratricopeptide (TPR) repeat protein
MGATAPAPETTPMRPPRHPPRARRPRALPGALAVLLSLAPVARAATEPPAPAGASARDPGRARELTDKGIAAQTAGQHLEALALFDAALLAMDHPKIRYFRAKSLRALGRNGEALAAFQVLVGVAEVEKYRAEIEAFIRAIEGDAALEREREAREAAEKAAEKAERARQEAEAEREAVAVKVLQSRRSGLLPPPESRLRLGPVSGRMVPTVPSFQGPNAEAQRALEARAVSRQLAIFESYGTARLVSGILGGIAATGLGVGAAFFFVPGGGLEGDAASESYRVAGLTSGVVGVVAAVAALAVWPAEPPLGLARDPLASAR